MRIFHDTFETRKEPFISAFDRTFKVLVTHT